MKKILKDKFKKAKMNHKENKCQIVLIHIYKKWEIEMKDYKQKEIENASEKNTNYLRIFYSFFLYVY